MKENPTVSGIRQAFELPNRSDWLAQVRKELGADKSQEDLAWLVEDGILLEALPEPEQPVQPISWKTKPDWKIVECWDPIAFRRFEEELHRYEIDEVMLTAREIRELEAWLRQPVTLPVHLSIQLPAHEGDLPGETWQHLRSQDFLMFEPLEEPVIHHLSRHDTLKPVWYYASASEHHSPSQQLTEVLTQIIRLLNNTASLPVTSWRIYLPLDHRYQTQIARIRALQILLLNLWQICRLPPETCPEIYARIPVSDQLDPYSNLIACTCTAMAAVIANVDAICFNHSHQSTDQPESRRLIRNIHYILKYESHLTQQMDPLAGSFLIEKLTRMIAEKVWNEIRGMDLRRASM
jgi:hypothetical protein